MPEKTYLPAAKPETQSVTWTSDRKRAERSEALRARAGLPRAIYQNAVWDAGMDAIESELNAKEPQA